MELKHSFTGTSGVEDGMINTVLELVHLPEELETRCLRSFINKYQTNSGVIRPQYKTVYNFLVNLKKYLNKKYNQNIDPIKYIYNLYWGEEEISARDIYYRIGHLGNYKSTDAIEKMMKRVFGWPMRDHNTVTQMRSKKNRAGVRHHNKSLNDQKNQKIESLEKILGRISRDKVKYEISEENIINLPNIPQRVKYILNSIGVVRSSKFNSFIQTLSLKYGVKVTAQAVENIINRSHNGEKINFNPGRIREITK